MPSQTFNNLSDEKKQRIFKAIYLELVRVPFPEMSINKIIKNADIPRGSFYQYFENKDDAFDYFVNESSKRVKEKVIRRINTVHGDIFELSETVFEEIVDIGLNKEFMEILRHIVPYANMHKLQPLSEYIENLDREKKIEACCALGIGNLDIKDEEELMDLIGVIEALFQSALPVIYCGERDFDDVKIKFKRRLNIIRKATRKAGV